eukprot:jgi/Phyca11/11312/fgenesh1_pm.PHYCAscaffold_66_\
MGKVKQQQSNPPDDGDELAGSTLEDYFASHKVSGLVSQHLLNIPAENDEHYEDDYEAETSTSEVAGMSLSDYLHVKEDEKPVRAGSARTLPPQLAAPKKSTPMLDVSGMSLDHYLGAVVDDQQAVEKKSSPKVKRTGSNSDEENSASAPSSSLTPFQRRQKRKEKAKAKIQRNSGGGAPVSKAILMAEPSSSKERRKGPLAAANASHYSGHHSSSSKTEDNDNTVEKLPPL